MAEDHVRQDLVVKTVLEILRDAGTKVSQSQVVDELQRRVTPTPYELSLNKSGDSRWETALNWHSGDAATVGWMSKIGG